MDASGQPAAPAQLWAELPKTGIQDWGMDITNDQVAVALVKVTSDLWLVEFSEK